MCFASLPLINEQYTQGTIFYKNCLNTGEVELYQCRTLSRIHVYSRFVSLLSYSNVKAHIALNQYKSLRIVERNLIRVN